MLPVVLSGTMTKMVCGVISTRPLIQKGWTLLSASSGCGWVEGLTQNRITIAVEPWPSWNQNVRGTGDVMPVFRDIMHREAVSSPRDDR
jgi:hypothetical protein